VEWGVTEADALAYCEKRGFTWGGLYRFFDRVSCFCCPLQSLHDLRTLRRHFPDLWQRMLDMEAWMPEGDIGRRFNHSSMSRLENRFYGEDAEYERQYEEALCEIEAPQFI
jgi:hypothetical protein